MATSLAPMPHRDAKEACRVILEKFPESPCIPRLSLSARMFMEGMPCLLINSEKRRLNFDLSRTEELEIFYEKYQSDELEYFAISPKYGPGFYSMIDMLRICPPKELKIIHIHMPGIVTWGLTLRDLQGKPAWYEPTMRDVLIKNLIMKAKWQERKIKENIPGIKTMVTLGEPTLSIVNSPFGSISGEEMISTLNEFFGSIESLSCVHCCSNMDWSQLMKANIYVINFDAFQYSEKIALYPNEINTFFKKGGILAWGIVPVEEEALISNNEDSLQRKLEKAIEELANEGIDKKLILERSFITPCCTTAMLSIKGAEKVYKITSNLSRLMREKYFL